MIPTTRIPWRQLSLRGLIASVILAALLGIVAILSGDFGELQARVLLSTATIGTMSVLGLACGSYLDRDRGNLIARGGIVATIASAAMIFPIIWDYDSGSTYVKLLFTITILAVAAAHLSLLWLAQLAPAYRWSQRGAVVAIAAAVLLLFVIIWGELENTPLWRTLGTVAIVDAAFTLMVPIFHRMSIGRVEEPGGRLAAIDRELAQLRTRMATLEEERARLVVPGGRNALA